MTLHRPALHGLHIVLKNLDTNYFHRIKRLANEGSIKQTRKYEKVNGNYNLQKY